MAQTLDTIKTLNSVARTGLTVVILAALAGGGWWGYHTIESGRREQLEQLEAARRELEQQAAALAERDARIAEQDRRIRSQAGRIDALGEALATSERRNEQLQTAMNLLKVDRRLARITVLDQGPDPRSGRLVSTVEFVELDERGNPLDEPRVVDVTGDMVYVDCWVVKFEEHYVEDADELRSTSLVLFHRIFGEHQQPTDGYVLDRIGVRPKAYSRGAPLSEFEEGIWNDFWQIANAPQQARELGIRAAHGQAISMKLRKGSSYDIMLRASDGLSLVP